MDQVRKAPSDAVLEPATFQTSPILFKLRQGGLYVYMNTGVA